MMLCKERLGTVLVGDDHHPKDILFVLGVLIQDFFKGVLSKRHKKFVGSERNRFQYRGAYPEFPKFNQPFRRFSTVWTLYLCCKRQ